MREIRPITSKEIAYYRENIRRIEESMDHPIPRGLYNVEDLGRPMTPQEISLCRENIRRLEEVRHCRSRRYNNHPEEGSSVDSRMGITLLGLFLLIGSIGAGEFALLPVAIVLLIPAIYRLIKRIIN